MGLANSVALEVAGVSKLSEDPKGGTISRTADGGDIDTVQVFLRFNESNRIRALCFMAHNGHNRQ